MAKKKSKWTKAARKQLSRSMKISAIAKKCLGIDSIEDQPNNPNVFDLDRSDIVKALEAAFESGRISGKD